MKLHSVVLVHCSILCVSLAEKFSWNDLTSWIFLYQNEPRIWLSMESNELHTLSRIVWTVPLQHLILRRVNITPYRKDQFLQSGTDTHHTCSFLSLAYKMYLDVNKNSNKKKPIDGWKNPIHCIAVSPLKGFGQPRILFCELVLFTYTKCKAASYWKMKTFFFLEEAHSMLMWRRNNSCELERKLFEFCWRKVSDKLLKIHHCFVL